MKLKELESLLQDVRPFESPKVELEQYPTGPHLAACMLYTIESAHNGLDGKTVIDLGSGTGMLSIGCALLGASHVVGLELDTDALAVAMDNVEQFEDPLPIDFVQCNVLELLDPSHAACQSSTKAGPGYRSGQGHQRKGQPQTSAGKQARGTWGRQNHRRSMPSESETESEEEEEEDVEEGEAGEEDASGRPERQQEQQPTHDRRDDAGGLQQQLQATITDLTADDSGTQGASMPQQPLVQGTCPAGSATTSAYPMAVLAQLRADTVVINPPFGTKSSKGIDMLFLRAAFMMCRGCVYSLHKSSTRSHIHMVAMKQLGALRADVVAELRYDLPATMKFHKQKSVDVQVDLWRFQVGATD